MTKSQTKKRLSQMEDSLRRLRDQSLSKQEAIEILENCAALKREGTYLKATYPEFAALIHLAIGREPRSLDSDVPIGVGPAGTPTAHTVRLARGVNLRVSDDNKLAAISIQPARFREGEKLMSFVGTGIDTATDVARNHDKYYVETIELRLNLPSSSSGISLYQR